MHKAKIADLTLEAAVKAFSIIAVSTLWLYFAMAHYASYKETGKLSLLLITAAELITVYFYIQKHDPKGVTRSIGAWASGLGATFLPLLFRPSAEQSAGIGDLFILIGSCLLLASILSLGKSFGIIAADRKLVTSGMYSFVRHPMYISYFFLLGGYLLTNITVWNALLVFTTLTLQIVRIRYEEEVLRKDHAYADYARKVKWRLVPGVY